MKILLRNYGREQYVWETAKYHDGAFYVNRDKIKQDQIVSIVNDNRKNYVQCSCCGQTFKKGSRKFQQHKENAAKMETCFNCPNMMVDYHDDIKRSFYRDKYGHLIQKSEDRVTLKCTRSGMWEYDNIESEAAISNCKKRQCGDATKVEINDFFMSNPGAFDDIITIDVFLDAGHEIGVAREGREGSNYDIDYEEDYSIGVNVNRLGIIDCFYVWYNGDRHYIYYSKKYNELFESNLFHKYDVWYHWDMEDEMRAEIKAKIAKFYR